MFSIFSHSTIAHGQDAVPVPAMMNAFNAEGHPKVQTGEYTADQVFDEFFTSFPSAVPGNDSGVITYQEFVDYYSDLSAVYPYSDDTFAAMMKGLWGVSEPLAASAKAVSAQRRDVASVRQLIADKIQQRSKAGASETDTLRRCFKTFDMDDDGLLDMHAFYESLATFGVFLNEKQKKIFFDSIAVDGKVDYLAFTHSLFGADEGLLPVATSTRAIQVRKPTMDKSASMNRPAVTRNLQKDNRAMNASGSADVIDGMKIPPAGTINPNIQEKSKSPRENSEDDFPAILFLLGGPGSGVTTQASAVAARLGFAHVSVELLLAHAFDDTTSPYHTIIKHSAQQNKPVPVEVVVSLIKDEMSALYEDGFLNFVIDGFPRSIAHLRAWSDMMGRYCRPPCYVFLDVDETTMTDRCAANENMNERTFSAKMGVYKKDTLPLCDALYAQKRLFAVDGLLSAEEITERILDIIANV